MFCVLLQTATRSILTSLITFLTTLIVHSIKRFYETYRCTSSMACQEKRTDWILRIFTLNDKNPLYLPIISTLQFLWGSKWSRSNPISHKTIWHIRNIKNSAFKIKKMAGFSKLSFIFHLFLQAISHINSATNPPSPIINVVCKYLRQVLCKSFGISTLLIYCNIE